MKRLFFVTVIVSILAATPFAALAEWVDADGTGRESMRITYTGASGDSHIDIDSSGFPHLVWGEGYWSTEVDYMKWNGTFWQDIDAGGPLTADAFSSTPYSYNLSFMLDSLDRPHIAWRKGEVNQYELYYMKWNGSAWTDYNGAVKDSLKVYTSPGLTWVGHPALALNTADKPRLSWTKVNNEIYFMQENGGVWSDADGSGMESLPVLPGSFAPGGSVLRIDSAGRPHVMWYGASNMGNPATYGIYYFKWDGGAWVDVDGSGTESAKITLYGQGTQAMDFVLDSANRPHVIYDDYNPVYVINYMKWDGGAWVDADGSGLDSTKIPDLGFNPSSGKIRLDAAGRPHIGFISTRLEYASFSDYEVCHVEWNGSAWVDAAGSIGLEKMSASLPGYISALDMCLNGAGDPFLTWTQVDDLSSQWFVYMIKWDPLAPENTMTHTPTITKTDTISPTHTVTETETETETITQSLTPTETPSATGTPSAAESMTFTPVFTATGTPEPSIIPTATVTMAASGTIPATATFTQADTPPQTPTPSMTATLTETPSTTATPTITPSVAPPATATLTQTPWIEGDLHVFPNPCSPGNGSVKFRNLFPGSIVYIYSLSGESVAQIEAPGGVAEWNRKTRLGDAVSPGVYYYFIENSSSSAVFRGRLFITGR